MKTTATKATAKQLFSICPTATKPNTRSFTSLTMSPETEIPTKRSKPHISILLATWFGSRLFTKSSRHLGLSRRRRRLGSGYLDFVSPQLLHLEHGARRLFLDDGFITRAFDIASLFLYRRSAYSLPLALPVTRKSKTPNGWSSTKSPANSSPTIYFSGFCLSTGKAGCSDLYFFASLISGSRSPRGNWSASPAAGASWPTIGWRASTLQLSCVSRYTSECYESRPGLRRSGGEERQSTH